MASNRDTLKQISLYDKLCSKENLFLAYLKAKKHKTKKSYVIDFEKDLIQNLDQLRVELLLHSYQPKQLISFIICDPKTRIISKSHFKDRVVHHALCNVIEPIFDKTFIYDSFANRKRKGTSNAIKRFESFKRKASMNCTKKCFCLKADIRKYFDNVNHDILINIIKKIIPDERIIWLIRKILSNYELPNAKGMPLGNLTSQFFANVYLNELDQFVKHKLKAKYYIRYVDDFIILESKEEELSKFVPQIQDFLLKKLELTLHPNKTKIMPVFGGVPFLGMRIYNKHRLLKRNNIQRFKKKIHKSRLIFTNEVKNYNEIYALLEGWLAYAKGANTYCLRQKIINLFQSKFSGQTADVEIIRWYKISKNTLDK